MKMLLLMLLVGFSALTVEGEVTETPNSPAVIETPGSPVVIESATLGFDETAASVLKIVARASEPVDSFTARVRIYEKATDKKPLGMVSRALGPVGLEPQTFEVRLGEWFIENQHIRVSVGNVQAGPSPKEGICYGFCASERLACRMDCGTGCIARFVCKLSPSACESDCQCKATCP
jgi:hypothetical protein